MADKRFVVTIVRDFSTCLEELPKIGGTVGVNAQPKAGIQAMRRVVEDDAVGNKPSLVAHSSGARTTVVKCGNTYLGGHTNLTAD